MLYKNSVTIMLLLLLLLPITTDAIEPYSVRTVYFMPTDSIDRSDWLDLNDIMKNVQSTYRDEMNRHGFPNQTFRLETDHNNRIIVHKFNGRHNKAHYSGNTIGLVTNEIKHKFNDERNIYMVVMAGMDALQSGFAAGIASARPGGWFIEGKDHGYALSVETTKDHVERVIMHELGHTFGLWHIALYDPSDQIMGSGRKLSEHESRWLSKSYYFQDNWIPSFAPSISHFHKPQSLNNNHIQFNIDVSDPEGLHQAYVASQNTNIVGWDYLGGINDTVTFDVGRWLVSDDTQPIWIQVMDNNGNWLWYQQYYKLPKQEEFEDGTKYLTIRNKRDVNSLTPVNGENEWVGWQNAGIFEKIHGGVPPNLPDWYLDFPNMDKWEHWFYSHANSRFVYDISGKQYNRFESHFYMPNPCNRVASVRVICFADDIEVYQSEILRAPAAQNKHIVVDFPEDTKKLTIQITDALDGITCDHFVFGEPIIKIVSEEDKNLPVINEDEEKDLDIVNQDENEEHIEPPDETICVGCEIDADPRSVNSKSKLTTTWGAIKGQ